MDAVEQRRVSGDRERIEVAFINRQSCDLAGLRFNVEAQHVEIGRYPICAARDIERERGDGDACA